VAAEAQGKFWEMHDKLFASQQDLSRPALETYARQIGLDVPRFRAALDNHQGRARVDADRALGQRLGIDGTPNFFVNGRNVQGAQPFEEFKRVVDDEIARADKLLAAGTTPLQLYPTLLKGAGARLLGPPPEIIDAGAEVYKVPLGDAPARGGAQPKVTIVEFSDFQCPFCGRVQPALGQLLRDYGGDVELAFRHTPLPFHANAIPAALAAEAARAQGKFWEMHDKLYANQTSLDRPSLERYAREIGLDLQAFRRALDGGLGKDRIQRDLDLATRFGVRGTPTFFINGRIYPGAQPIEGFKKVINDEINKANGKLAAGTPRAELYAALIKDGLDKKELPPPVPDADELGPEMDPTVYPVDPTKGPSRGPKDAPLQVVIFSDFQCPFCKRIEPTLAQLQKVYRGRVHLVWKNYPLPFHDNAGPAAEAALAAQAQGKFWEMHDKLFANQQHLDRDTYERYAGELGLDLPRFKADLDGKRFKDQIEADRKDGEAVGVTGTPAVFINGRKIAGAYPWKTFKQIADTELAKKQSRSPAERGE
jgi:protein-disulfide isomerase